MNTVRDLENPEFIGTENDLFYINRALENINNIRRNIDFFDTDPPRRYMYGGYISFFIVTGIVFCNTIYFISSKYV